MLPEVCAEARYSSDSTVINKLSYCLKTCSQECIRCNTAVKTFCIGKLYKLICLVKGCCDRLLAVNMLSCLKDLFVDLVMNLRDRQIYYDLDLGICKKLLD